MAHKDHPVGNLLRSPSPSTLLNCGLFITIPSILVILHFFLPGSVHEAMLFDHSQFTFYTLWTAAFVHGSDGHLFRNLLGYVMAMVPAWLIFSYHYRQWVIRWIYIAFITILPILVSLSSYAVYQFWFGAEEAVSQGFSGVVTAIFGLVFISMLKVGYDARGWPGVIGLMGASLLITMIRMLIRANSASADTLVLGIGGGLLSLTLLIPPEQIKERRLTPRLTEKGKVDLLMVIYGSAVFIYVLPLMFPLNWIRPNQVVDIFGHFAGLVFGVLSGIVVILWLKSKPQSHSRWLDTTPK